MKGYWNRTVPTARTTGLKNWNMARFILIPDKIDTPKEEKKEEKNGTN